jgi:hypothetical protein
MAHTSSAPEAYAGMNRRLRWPLPEKGGGLMTIHAKLRRIEGELGISGTTHPFVLLIGCKGGRKCDEAELQQRIDDAIRRRPHARLIMLLCGGR